MAEQKWIKVKVPVGLGAVTIDGVTYVAHDGVTDVPADKLEQAVKCGCRPHDTPEPDAAA